jgi:prepilin-type N-terminal cleavage/methylation domain-containing protein
MQWKAHPGFTITELLISLSVLACIATFTIPKVLQTSMDQKYNAAAKETMAAVYSAYDSYRLANGGTAPSTMTPANLTPYLNYVKIDTGIWIFIDGYQGNDFLDCNAFNYCLRMHNGGTLMMTINGSFGGTATTNAIIMDFDPDSRYSASLTGPGKSLEFLLYYNGRMTSRANCAQHTYNTVFADFGPAAGSDPTWFSW